MPGATGETVMNAVVQRLKETFKIGDDRSFFNRYSFAESRFGEIVHSHYENVKQIWPISQEKFKLTKVCAAIRIQ